MVFTVCGQRLLARHVSHVCAAAAAPTSTLPPKHTTEWPSQGPSSMQPVCRPAQCARTNSDKRILCEFSPGRGGFGSHRLKKEVENGKSYMRWGDCESEGRLENWCDGEGASKSTENEPFLSFEGYCGKKKKNQDEAPQTMFTLEQWKMVCVCVCWGEVGVQTLWYLSVCNLCNCRQKKVRHSLDIKTYKWLNPGTLSEEIPSLMVVKKQRPSESRRADLELFPAMCPGTYQK